MYIAQQQPISRGYTTYGSMSGGQQRKQAKASGKLYRRKPMQRQTHSKQDLHPNPQVAFTFAVIALASKLMKSGNMISRNKYVKFCDVFPMQKEEEEKARALLFRMAKETPSYRQYVRQIHDIFPDRTDMYHEVVSRLLQIAAADHELSSDDERYIADIAKEFDISETRWQVMVSRYGLNVGESNPYKVLGVHTNVSNDTLKTRYRVLTRKYHPDYQLAGQSHDMTKARWLNRKMAIINEAYDAILRERGLKRAIA